MTKWYHIFFPDKEKGKDDGKLRLRVRWGSNIIAFNLGYRVDISKWSYDTQRCKNNTTHGKKKIAASIINREINRYETALETILYRYEKENTIPTKQQLKDELSMAIRGTVKQTKTSTSDFNNAYNTFTQEMGFQNSWTTATFQKFATLKNHLDDYCQDLTFDELNEDGLANFVAHLRDGANLRNSTIKKNLAFLKWFLRWSLSKGYTSIRDFETFSPKLKDTEKKVIYLEWDELMAVYNFHFPANKQYLEKVRDVFCFCCFTSLRYSDAANLKRHNIFDDHIEITTIKTGDPLHIELNDYSREILDKYKDVRFEGNKALPVISNQKMNLYIKEMGYVCGIDSPVNITYYRGSQRIDEVYPKYELLGTHCGRRTFICNALMLGISPEVVMKWTGHSDYKSMKPYIDIADSAKAKAMDLFNKRNKKQES